jgi:hypothetical protein
MFNQMKRMSGGICLNQLASPIAGLVEIALSAQGAAVLL